MLTNERALELRDLIDMTLANIDGLTQRAEKERDAGRRDDWLNTQQRITAACHRLNKFTAELTGW